MSGCNFRQTGRSICMCSGWVCNWSLLEVPGVGHDGMRMLAMNRCSAPLSGLTMDVWWSQQGA
eukprot:29621-Eustigmatos_ZCMA.PRE.2